MRASRPVACASCCGIVGLKPTYGRCSRWGIVAFASSLDQAGPMARDVRDCAILLEAMAGFDPKDSTSLDLPVPQWEAGLSSDLKGKRVGIPKEYRIDGVPAEINALWDQGIAWLKEAGAEAVEISLPHTKYALPTYYIIAPAEASSNLARYDGVRYGLRVPGRDVVEQYIDAWERADVNAILALLAEDNLDPRPFAALCLAEAYRDADDLEAVRAHLLDMQRMRRREEHRLHLRVTSRPSLLPASGWAANPGRKAPP